MNIDREELLMKLGAARAEAPAAWRLIDITISDHTAAFSVVLNRQKLRSVRRREGRYLCAPICPDKILPSSGSSTFSSSKSKPPSRP